jgi:hypothetical protein
MHYKTMVLELLQQRPRVHDRLRRQRLLLPTMELYARELKDLHEGWKQHLAETNPDSDESQTASQALELALKELEGCLPSDSSLEAADRPSLDDFMTYLRDHTPPG